MLLGKPIVRVDNADGQLHALLPLLAGKGPNGELVLDLSKGFSTIVILPGGNKVRITVEPVEVDRDAPVKKKPAKKRRKKKELDFDL